MTDHHKLLPLTVQGCHGTISSPDSSVSKFVTYVNQDSRFTSLLNILLPIGEEHN